MKKEKIFWGAFFILASVFLIVSKLGILPDIGILKWIFTVFLISILVKSLVKLNYTGILFSIAFICILYDNELHITQLTPWPVLGAALLGSIGCSMLFHNKKRQWYYYQGEKKSREEFEQIFDSQDEGRVFFKNSFGSSTKYINTDEFEFAQLECFFGGMKVYFDNAVIPKGNATVQLDISFSGVELYVPKTWNVVNQIDFTFGGMDEKNRNQSSGMPTLTLMGDAAFSGVTIIYI